MNDGGGKMRGGEGKKNIIFIHVGIITVTELRMSTVEVAFTCHLRHKILHGD